MSAKSAVLGQLLNLTPPVARIAFFWCSCVDPADAQHITFEGMRVAAGYSRVRIYHTGKSTKRFFFCDNPHSRTKLGVGDGSMPSPCDNASKEDVCNRPWKLSSLRLLPNLQDPPRTSSGFANRSRTGTGGAHPYFRRRRT